MYMFMCSGDCHLVTIGRCTSRDFEVPFVGQLRSRSRNCNFGVAGRAVYEQGVGGN